MAMYIFLEQHEQKMSLLMSVKMMMEQVLESRMFELTTADIATFH